VLKKKSLQSLNVIPLLPDWLHPSEGDALPEGLIGATVVRFGTTERDADLEGGGLIIDYQPPNNTCVMRAVFEFSELGMELTSLVALADHRDRM
jgi:hypothetical protein